MPPSLSRFMPMQKKLPPYVSKVLWSRTNYHFFSTRKFHLTGSEVTSGAISISEDVRHCIRPFREVR
jgi:hypothetical protein